MSQSSERFELVPSSIPASNEWSYSHRNIPLDPNSYPTLVTEPTPAMQEFVDSLTTNLVKDNWTRAAILYGPRIFGVAGRITTVYTYAEETVLPPVEGRYAADSNLVYSENYEPYKFIRFGNTVDHDGLIDYEHSDVLLGTNYKPMHTKMGFNKVYYNASTSEKIELKTLWQLGVAYIATDIANLGSLAAGQEKIINRIVNNRDREMASFKQRKEDLIAELAKLERERMKYLEKSAKMISEEQLFLENLRSTQSETPKPLIIEEL